ncbi:MAG: UvrD-helicase domain-containing protein [Gammaproteobacteria bacterium]|jgi:ATP-dependent helicase/nuclease subunit A
MAEAPLATRPDRSFSVLASAGTGKTWQLVARLVRLLLHGARLDSILAITFTRKAAGEMQLRLNQRLQELLEADDSHLDAVLTAIGETPTGELRERARRLLEHWLRAEYGLRTTTFHSFCRELLQRFPLEADLPPGFELAEQTGLLIEESWEALFAEATAAPEQPLGGALELLFENLNGLYNTRSALYDFVEHRSDWWAFTHRTADPVQAATRHLQEKLGVDPQIRSGGDFWDLETRQRLAEFSALLGRHETRTNQGHIASLEAALSRAPDAETAATELRPVFFTASGERRKRASTSAQRKAMGEAGEGRFLELHAWFCERLEVLTEEQNRRRTLRTNAAWYAAGQRMLGHYQRIKRERRLLDFADLEWNTYLLLSHPEHAHWVQFKLDQRIDHLLIDEFQDTNPTQWQLIVPLLEEMAAGDERGRSLFIVGDAKQSIYRFRRGNPRLLGRACAWMQTRLNAGQIHLDASRRSSPAVLEFVNRVFLHPQMHPLLADFQEHGTHRTGAWGRVEFWPLVGPDGESDSVPCAGLRNPLQHPRPVCLDQRHYREGRAIAGRIQELVGQLGIDYGDVLILMRSRTHLQDYEAALRDSGIPYLSLDRGTLLQSLEIRDLEALLVVLMTPQDNLSLAQVLRSPIFSADDEDLMRVARGSTGPWFERLDAVAQTLPPDHSLARATRLLEEWRTLAGRVPIHDLLERIFHQANLLDRYRAALPETEAARVYANLTRFVELALEVDSGRYPTLPRFLARVRQLRNLDREGPSQATPSAQGGQRVRLLTVHAAKGLEAPVVFLADSTNEGNTPPGSQSLVRWPAEADRPTDFMLLSNAKQRDSVSRTLYGLEQQEEQRESANLLYVALTRAKHMLVISGCAQGAQGRSKGWYQQMAQALFDRESPEETWVHEFLSPPQPRPRPPANGSAAVDLDPRLRGTITTRAPWREIAPSRAEGDRDFEPGDALGATRGLIIHRMLQLAADSGSPAAENGKIAQQVAAEFGRASGHPMLEECRREVERLLNDSDLAWLFHPGPAASAFSEVPIEYLDGQQTVFGVIDRLVVCDGIVHLIDYKTHRVHDASRLHRVSGRYRTQLALYREGVRRLWPDHRINACLLFTHAGKLVEIG